jgi:hypothetical protein
MLLRRILIVAVQSYQRLNSAFFKDSSVVGQNWQSAKGPIFPVLPPGQYAIVEGVSRVPQARVS